MKLKYTILLATALISTSALARNAWVIAPNQKVHADLFGKTLSFVLPPRMRLVTNKRSENNLLMEHIPQGENLTNWTRMVTIQAYRGLGKSPEPSADIARRAFYPAACRIGPIYRESGDRVVASGLRRSILATGCASLPAGAYPLALAGAGEQDFIMMFRDGDTVYTLNYAERGAPFTSKTLPHDPADAEAILEQVLGTVTLCSSTKPCGRH